VLTISTLWLALLAFQGSIAHPSPTFPPFPSFPSFRLIALAQSSDSLDILRGARQAQRDFERVRRINLPYDWDHRSGPCDVRIGRFCYWYHPSPNRPPEPAAIGRARARLLRELAADAARLPGDDWILGQRVRYLVEHRRAGSAVALTRACRGTPWWCYALEGFARHAGRDYAGADQAFERALSGMPEKQRCAWTDLSPLLKDARPYRRLPCAERLARGHRIWWLADPLYSVAGNDLRTEHYSRHTMVLLLDDAANPYGLFWGNDMQELVIRFGWPTHWSRAFGRSLSLEPSPVVGHEADPSFWLFPRPVFTEPWSDVTVVRWEPTMDRPPARYAPPYATGLVPITGVQFARFRRSDTALTIAAVDLTADSIFAEGPIDLRLAIGRDPATPVAVGRASPSRPLGVVAVRSQWRPAVLSLEAMKADPGPIGWRRVMLPPDPAGLAPVLSDILLLGPTDERPRSLDEAAGVALSPAEVRVGQRVGLYWEMYAVPDSAQPLEVAVTVNKARSKGKAPYPVGRPQCPPRVASPVAVRWREAPGARASGVGRSIALDLRPLSRGRYVVAIQISEAGRPRGCSSRELQIVE
jgi:hypothetical protein